jgi:HK97 family phage major capsid protein
MHNLNSLRKDHAHFLGEMERLVTLAEGRTNKSWLPTEEAEFNAARRQCDVLGAQIQETEQTWRKSGINVGSSRFNPAQFAADFTSGQSATGPFSSFAEQIGAVIQAGKHGQRTDERLFEVRAASGLNEGVGSEGGFLVQSDFAASILSHVYTVGEIARRCTRIPITTNASGIKIPRIDEQSRADGSRWGGVRGYWTTEGGAIQTSKPAFGLLELNLKKVAAAVYCTDELVEDSAALSAFLSMVVPQELTYKVEDAIVNGDGVGKPQGLTVSPACITVAKITGQAQDTFSFENATSMWQRYGGTEAGACWLIHRSVIPQLYSMAVVGGVSMWPAFTPTPAAAAPPSTLFGKPLIVAEYCQKLGDKGDVVLADLSQYVLIEKGGVQAASSIHVRFLEAEQVLRFIYRVDGQSAWATAITPKNGTDSLSPWVVLAERA